jgi:hypothetical protein
MDAPCDAISESRSPGAHASPPKVGGPPPAGSSSVTSHAKISKSKQADDVGYPDPPVSGEPYVLGYPQLERVLDRLLTLTQQPRGGLEITVHAHA